MFERLVRKKRLSPSSTAWRPGPTMRSRRRYAHRYNADRRVGPIGVVMLTRTIPETLDKKGSRDVIFEGSQKVRGNKVRARYKTK